MESLIIPATDTTPKIHFDIDTLTHGKYIFEITGESRPEDVADFYTPVTGWLQQYKSHLSSLKNQSDYSRKIKIRLKFRLDFFNSSTAKYLFDILQNLEDIKNLRSMADVKVIWIYREEDEDIYEAGLELKKLTTLPFELSQLREGEVFS